MRTLNLIAMVVLIIGGLNWLLVGVAQYDIVAAIFGGTQAIGSRVFYVLVGIAAIWQLIALMTREPLPLERRP